MGDRLCLQETKRRGAGELGDEVGNVASGQSARDVADSVEVAERRGHFDGVYIGHDGDHGALAASVLERDDKLRGGIVGHVVDELNVGIEDGVALGDIEVEKATPELVGLDNV